MMSKSGANAARNLIAGLLMGYGFVSFFCFIILQEMWIRVAPVQPNEALGLIYKHNNHGSYTYFSLFQATACGLLFETSIPLVFAGALIAPKKWMTGTKRRDAARSCWGYDDPSTLMEWAALAGGALSPLFVFFVGPHIIRALNAIGFVMDLG